MLCTRGVLLWFVVPLAFAVWLVVVLPLKRRSVTGGQLLGWVDLNLIAGLERTVLRPLGAPLTAWVPLRDLSDVTHRVHPLRDLA